MTEVSLAVKTLKYVKARGCDEIFEHRRNTLAYSCVLSGLAIWEDTKHCNTRDITFVHPEVRREECTNYRGNSLLSLPGKVYAKCREKRFPEITEHKLKISSAVFVPCVILLYALSLFNKRLFCRPRKGIRPGPSRKPFRSFAGIRCWRPPATDIQFIVFLFRRCVGIRNVKWKPLAVITGLQQGCVLSSLTSLSRSWVLTLGAWKVRKGDASMATTYCWKAEQWQINCCSVLFVFDCVVRWGARITN